MAKLKSQRKGIFCLETPAWKEGRDEIKDKSTVEPLLRLLEMVCKIPYLHHDVATIAEFDFYLEKWSRKSLDTHPILYLGFHGGPGTLGVGEGDGISLSDLAERLDGRCTGRVIHFGCCDTLRVHGHYLNEFLRQTGALAVCGYKAGVEWLLSAAFDLLVLRGLQEVSFRQAPSMRTLEDILKKDAPGLMRNLEFRIQVRQ